MEFKALNSAAVLTWALAFAAMAGLFAASQPAHAASETAIFAGGCFWCVESDMDHVKGVSETISTPMSCSAVIEPTKPSKNVPRLNFGGV